MTFTSKQLGNERAAVALGRETCHREPFLSSFLSFLLLSQFSNFFLQRFWETSRSKTWGNEWQNHLANFPPSHLLPAAVWSTHIFVASSAWNALEFSLVSSPSANSAGQLTLKHCSTFFHCRWFILIMGRFVLHLSKICHTFSPCWITATKITSWLLSSHSKRPLRWT